MPAPDHYLSTFFLLGLVVVACYAWKRFDEPSFQNHETLPRTVDPLRYLFLKRTYSRARFTYIAVSLVLYTTLVWPGPSIVPALGIIGAKDFPAEGWALLVALFLVGFIPNSNMKWLTMIEERLRRAVHAWFLVPDRVVKTIGLLEDARYEPPPWQIEALPSSQRDTLQADMRAASNTVRYRWARATMLMASLNLIGTGVAHPLNNAAFGPFKEDFKAIKERYRVVARDVSTFSHDDAETGTEDDLIRSIEDLLKRIYAYISWGLRQQVDTERDVDNTLEELGFSIPTIGERRLFDIVAPAFLLIAGIAMGFWFLYDLVQSSIGSQRLELASSVLTSLSSAIGASVMYGGAVLIALRWRASQIERKEWTQGSPRSLVPIALAAGILTWLVIIVITALWKFQETFQSLTGLALLLKSLAADISLSDPAVARWRDLPLRILTAAPWFLAGATASVLLAGRIGGDITTTAHRRLYDALVLGLGLGLAVATAQLIQISLAANLIGESSFFGVVPPVGLAGFACGATIGFVVPHAFRTSLREPFNPLTARALSELLRRARSVVGTQAADAWAYAPHPGLRGITPAEAIQYRGYASTVRGLLDRLPPGGEPGAAPEGNERGLTLVVEGGRTLG